MSSIRSLDIGALRAGYRQRQFTPLDVAREVLRRIAAAPEHHVWITRLADHDVLQRAQALMRFDPASLPLYGIPFAIKDNIDLAGCATTAACPAFSHVPAQSASAVQRLIDAGAIPIGKTNLDQFATGLVGTRSPYGACQNSFDARYISGGSSSGSAVAVAMGLVSFALATDTAGSGRVPAAFNNLIGYKPTCGLISPRGMVNACRTLDTISVLALTAEDASAVADVAIAYDDAAPYSRRAQRDPRRGWATRAAWRFGVPRRDQLQFFGNDDYAKRFDASIATLQKLGGLPTAIDFEPFLATARLLYEGPWVAERYLATRALLEENPQALHPVTKQIVAAGREPTAAAAFEAQYRLAELRRETVHQWQDIDVLVTPTAGTIYRIDELLAQPLLLNSNLGYYTNFVNLLDLAAVAVPTGFTSAGLPFGITLCGPTWSDADLLQLAGRVHRACVATMGATGHALPVADSAPATPDMIDVAVCGAHMQGLPLNAQLTARHARLKSRTITAPTYRFHALPGGPPWRPGLVRVASGGCAIEVEVWTMPEELFGSFVAGIPAPLGIGKVELADGTQVCGFVCEAHATTGAADISHFGGWRAYLQGQ